jgi:hypothetical protein
MTIQRLENVGIVVDDLAAATKTVIGSATSAGPEGLIVMLAEQIG